MNDADYDVIEPELLKERKTREYGSKPYKESITFHSRARGVVPGGVGGAIAPSTPKFWQIDPI